jgi:hypothetical protein
MEIHPNEPNTGIGRRIRIVDSVPVNVDYSQSEEGKPAYWADLANIEEL